MAADTSIIAQKEIPIVLLAEDSDDDAYFFERALKKACPKYVLHRAANGKLAVEALQKAFGGDLDEGHMPHLIFLDLKMPVMSGFDVLEWVQRSNLTYQPEIIVLSGSNDHEDRMRAAALGASEYLVKPIATEYLKRRLARLCESQAGERSGVAS